MIASSTVFFFFVSSKYRVLGDEMDEQDHEEVILDQKSKTRISEALREAADMEVGQQRFGSIRTSQKIVPELPESPACRLSTGVRMSYQEHPTARQSEGARRSPLCSC